MGRGHSPHAWHVLERLFARFRELARGKTALLISHRFSTVPMADKILVLSASRVVESGNHAELLARNDEYARLYRMQASRYTLGDG